VVFAQPSPNAIVLNRVAGARSTIDGNISANGKVFLVNARGIVFGPNALVNVGSLIATTADTNTDTFLQGNAAFRGTSPSSSAVLNQGSITAAPGGNVVLLAPRVSNTGSIRADHGRVVLATGRAFLIDVFGDGLLQVATDAVAGLPSPSITQLGSIEVGSGTLLVRRALGIGALQGTLNGATLSERANEAVSLPGGAVAFVGKANRPTANVDARWIKPVTVDGGGGVIDASPVYSLFSPAPVLGENPAPTTPSESQAARLTEFNRLSGRMPATAHPAESQAVADDALFDLSQVPAAAAMQPVNFDVAAPNSTQPKPANGGQRRRCTVADLVRGNCL
jgi:filamentous hemagglutinin family protein